MKIKAILIVLLLFAMCSDASAIGRRRNRTRTTTTYSSVSFSGGPQAVASAKASRAAARLNYGHQGGSFGGARYEGVGCGMTASAALGNCCYTGQKTVAGSAVVRGSNGMFYAVKLFW